MRTMHSWCVFVTLFLYFQYGVCSLWHKGVVHFAINTKDYDIHSQDIIMSAIGEIEKEICVKFFYSPSGYNSSTRVLYINNPDKRKNCPPQMYNFTSTVVDMPIGYKCIDQNNVSRIIVEMLRASIEQTAPITNSLDLTMKYQEMELELTRPFLLSPRDRNFINGHYHAECGSLSHPKRTKIETRRSGAITMSQANERFYNNTLWPLGIVMYGIERSLVGTPDHKHLKYAMTTIELGSDVVFKEVRRTDRLQSKNVLLFYTNGTDAPEFGFKEGNQIISLSAMVNGAPGHKAHTLNLLLRALGVPMMSNRADRDNHVLINWEHVEKGKEHFLEKHPASAHIHDSRLPYDFDSATHAPANFMCKSCLLGEATVQPLQDHLWQRVLYSMGRKASLSDGDKILLSIMYDVPVRSRLVTHDDILHKN